MALKCPARKRAGQPVLGVPNGSAMAEQEEAGDASENTSAIVSKNTQMFIPFHPPPPGEGYSTQCIHRPGFLLLLLPWLDTDVFLEGGGSSTRDLQGHNTALERMRSGSKGWEPLGMPEDCKASRCVL